MAVTPPAAGSADPATQLTTLPGWRQFVAAVPSIPHLLPGQDWLSLEDGKRAAHDEERLEHHSRLVVVQTPVIGRIVSQGGNLIRMNRLARYGRSGLMVSGPARTGKTTAVTQLGKTVEVTHWHRSPHSRDDIPVIYITVPPAATGKMIATEIARFLGLPVPRRANITDVIEPVCGICLDTRVTMIIVDELHNLDMSTRAGAEASDTLKYFSERLPVTFDFYAGIGLDRGALLAGPRGDQVAGRFTLIPASAFTPGQEWATLIAALEGALRLYRHKDGTLVTLADYLHRRTRGMIGSLLWLIRDAACQAILDGSEKISRKSLEQIAVHMTAQAPPAPHRNGETVTNMLPRDRAEQIMAEHAAGKPVRAIARTYGHSPGTVRDYVHGRRAPGEPAARADDFAPYITYCRQRLADDPHLRSGALLAEITGLGFPGTQRTFYRALERHEIQPHPCPHCHVARISGYYPLAEARHPQPSPLPVPAAPVNGETLASFLGRLAAVNRTSPDALLDVLPPWFRIKTRWHDDRWQHDQLSPWADDAAARFAVISGSAQPPLPSKTRFPPSGGSAASPPGPLSHAVSARQPAAYGNRSRCTCLPTTRSASGTASGYPAREHRNSASAAAPTSWPPSARPARSSAAAPSSS